MFNGTPTLESIKEVSESASAPLPSITRSIRSQRRPTRHVIREKDRLHEHFLLFNPFPLVTRNYAPHVGILAVQEFKKHSMLFKKKTKFDINSLWKTTECFKFFNKTTFFYRVFKFNV